MTNDMEQWEDEDFMSFAQSVRDLTCADIFLPFGEQPGMSDTPKNNVSLGKATATWQLAKLAWEHASSVARFYGVVEAEAYCPPSLDALKINGILTKLLEVNERQNTYLVRLGQRVGAVEHALGKPDSDSESGSSAEWSSSDEDVVDGMEGMDDSDVAPRAKPVPSMRPSNHPDVLARTASQPGLAFGPSAAQAAPPPNQVGSAYHRNAKRRKLASTVEIKEEPTPQ